SPAGRGRSPRGRSGAFARTLPAPRTLARVRIREVMTAAVVTAPAEATLADVAGLMRDRNVGSVVILERDRPAALITDRDVALAQQMTADVARAALPEFFFHQRGG